MENDNQNNDFINYDQNINISTNPKEVNWEITMLFMINKSEDGKVEIPGKFYDDLIARCKFVCMGFIHNN